MEISFFKMDCMTKKDKWAKKYIAHWIKNPDKNSVFEKNTRFIRWLPSRILFILLKCLGYSGVLLCVSGHIIGHAFYQKHDNEWHIFSVVVKESYRGKGYATAIITELLKNAQADCSLSGIRLGNGNSFAMTKLCEKITGNQFNLPLTCKQGPKAGMIVFVR